MGQQTETSLQTQLTDKARLKIVAAVPCFNTASHITDIVKRARHHVDQVIVVDDGSHDGTAEAARAAGAVVINHGANMGYGEAIKSCIEGIRANNADVAVILDGDRQHNPDEIPVLLAPILEGEADVVIGSRFISREHNMPRYRKFGIGLITFLWNLGSRIKVSDTQSGFRAYSRKALQGLSLRESGMGISIEILEKARRKGYVIKEVPISCLYVSSTLDLKAARHGFGVAMSVIRIRLKSVLSRLCIR